MRPLHREMLSSSVSQRFMANLIIASLRAKNKMALLKRLALDAAPFTKLDSRLLLSALLSREKLGCTGIGHGVALPHARLPLLVKPVSIFARLASPVHYGAVDGRRVDLVYMLLGPPIANEAHLRTISGAMQMLRDPDARQALRHAGDEREIETILPHYFQECPD